MELDFNKAHQSVVLGYHPAFSAHLPARDPGLGVHQYPGYRLARIHHERLRPGGAQQRPGNPVGSGRRRGRGLFLRFRPAQSARLFRGRGRA